MENRASADELRVLLYLACRDAPASARESTAALIIAADDQRLSQREIAEAVALLSGEAQQGQTMRSGKDTEQTVVGGLETVQEWAKLQPEPIRAAVEALVPQLERDHQYRLAEAASRRTHVTKLVGLIAGCIVSTALIAAAVAVSQETPWLAALLAVPSVLSLVFLFVLPRTDALLSRKARDSVRTVRGSSERSMDVDYRAYRNRRKRHDKWERRYRRERPREARRQEREQRK